MDDRTEVYTTDEYVRKNPSMHKEDSPWKLGKIRPVLDRAAKLTGPRVTILDVGGGAGEILSGAAAHLTDTHGKQVTKYALDLTPAMLDEQVKTNPDIRKALLEDIRHASLGAKEADITLMIDVIEHVPEPDAALREIGRISKYAIFKVPLEDNLHDKLWDVYKKGALRKSRIEQVGHINVYSYGTLNAAIEQHTGRVVCSTFVNVSSLRLGTPHVRKTMSLREVATSRLASALHRLSGRLASCLFLDHVVMLVECR